MDTSSLRTLIVSATYDDAFPEWYERLPEPKVRVSTKDGGHPSQAFIRAYRFDKQRHHSYLFLQDSLEPLVDDVVAPFRAPGEPVVAWGFFPLFFDNPEQQEKVLRQYPGPLPPYGIFGPIFYAERKALQRLDKLGMFPRTPENKMDAQGTERAWACAFYQAGVAMTALGPCVNDGESPILFPEDKTFCKFFAGRQ